MPRFFIKKKNMAGSLARITNSDAKHIRDVLRLKPGDRLVLFDETGFSYEATILSLSSKAVEASIDRIFTSNVESPLRLTVAQAYLKNGKMDMLIRQVTELGAAEWIPFMSSRSVPRPDHKRLNSRIKRWEKIAKESLKQCGRSRTPKITVRSKLKDVLELATTHDVKIIFSENESQPLCPEYIKGDKGSVGSALILLGPEGGFTEEEITQAEKHGFIATGMGPRILRADTATVAACALVQFLFGDMGEKFLDK
ncbi:MAG: 16S rRNA (uracil(1498)-N(3))-methyltransferase [Deltaproteobacteria bacterium]|nr:16S rRNA (uracil(1498)-N(3))-methyltransferase [Deltaproteobacteria bacterium]